MSQSSRISLSAIFSGLNDRTILALGLTQTLGYGTLYYAYGVLAPAISREFGVGIDWFFGAFTIGLLLGGLVAPLVGRELDRRGARKIMAAGSVGAALALVVCALSPNIWAFSAAVILAEAASCLVLYEAAFAGLTQIYRHEARRGITLITLIAGFASTIFWPLTQWMLGALDWRWTLAVFAIVHLLVCAPLHYAVLRRATPGSKAEVSSTSATSEPPTLVGAERQRALLIFTLSVVIAGIVTSAFPVHMLRIIENEGFTAETAALIAMVMGPAQVLARLLEVIGGHRFDPLMTGRVALLALTGAIVLLLATPGSLATAIIFAALYGIAQGLTTIARATVPLQLFGPTGYATLVGRITGWRFLANAASPFLFASAMTHLGIDAALWVSAAIAATALCLFLMLRAPKPAS
ncbi:MAG: MFS transporter, partial [Bosea sp. (in: a-proteobacteria)]